MNQSWSTTNHHRGVRHTAFTLVELLVVIVIIGILIALLIPAVMGAMAKSRNSAVAIEIANIGASLQAFKTQYQAGFPADFSFLDGAISQDDPVSTKRNQISQMLTRMFRYRQADDIPYNPYTSQQVAAQDLDCGEALVFWLMGFTDNSQRPLTGTPKTNLTTKKLLFPVLHLPSDPAELSLIEGAVTDYVLPEKTPLFDFDKTRLADRDKDGFPEYYPKYGGRVPYLYYNNSSYQFLYSRFSFGQPFFWLNSTTGGGNITGSVRSGNLEIPRAIPAPRPYVTKGVPTKERKDFGGQQAVLVLKNDFAASDTFQIIAAGLDGEFGDQVTAQRAGGDLAFPEGPYADKRHRDNVTNFAGGTLESKIP